METAQWIANAFPRLMSKNDDRSQEMKRVRDMGIKLLKLVSTCRAEGHDVGPLTYNLCISRLANAGHDVFAWKTYAEMRRHRLQPTQATYVWLMWASARRGDVDNVKKAWKEMRREGLGRTSPKTAKVQSQIFSALVMAYGVRKDEAGAFKIARSLVKLEGVRPNARNITVLVRACGSYRTAKATVRWGREEFGVQADLAILNALLTKCETEAHGAAVWREMTVERGLQPNCTSYSRLLGLFCRVGAVEKVLQGMAAQQDAVGLNTPSYIIVFAALAEAIAAAKPGSEDSQRYFDIAKALYETATGIGLGNNSLVNNNVLQCYMAYGDPELARDFMAHLASVRHIYGPRIQELVRSFFAEKGGPGTEAAVEAYLARPPDHVWLH